MRRQVGYITRHLIALLSIRRSLILTFFLKRELTDIEALKIGKYLVGLLGLVSGGKWGSIAAYCRRLVTHIFTVSRYSSRECWLLVGAVAVGISSRGKQRRFF